MTARYLVRLDDACETMNRRRWRQIEDVLDRHGVRPIVAVVPKNEDPKLHFDPIDGRFWEKVHEWHAKGWAIAMHGYRHVMHSTTAALFVPLYARSEFAGLTLEEQAHKIRSAWSLFLERGIEPSVWVAPAHSFDLLTLEALRAETPIRIVSDGIAWSCYSEYGFAWIPQQLWDFRSRRTGVWTVCLHPNTMDDDSIARLDRTLEAGFSGRTLSLQQLALSGRKKNMLDRLYHSYFWWQWRRERSRSRLRQVSDARG
jgi:predicted deacetylase